MLIKERFLSGMLASIALSTWKKTVEAMSASSLQTKRKGKRMKRTSMKVGTLLAGLILMAGLTMGTQAKAQTVKQAPPTISFTLPDGATLSARNVNYHRVPGLAFVGIRVTANGSPIHYVGLQGVDTNLFGTFSQTNLVTGGVGWYLPVYPAGDYLFHATAIAYAGHRSDKFIILHLTD